MPRKPSWTASSPVRRRDLLLGLGAGAAFLAPFYRRTRAWAQGRPGKGNFVMFYTPNGFARSQFGSDGNDDGFRLRRGMAKAEPMRAHFSVVRGLSNKAQCDSNPFHDQLTRFLTVVSGDPKVRTTAFGPSLDQKIAELTGTQPLTLKVYWSRLGNAGTYQYISWRKGGFVNGLHNDPRRAYADAFGSFMPTAGADPAEAQRVLDQKKSVLDFLKDDLRAFQGRLRPEDRARLGVHLDVVRDVETRLSAEPVAASPASPACPLDRARAAETTAPPNDSGPYDVPAFVQHGNLQASLLVAALACGARNSGLILWQGSAGGINPNGGSGKASDHHLISHHEAPYENWIQVDNWYAGRFAAFLQELQGAGILDQTAVAWGSDITEQHAHNNMVFVVGGGRALGIRHRKTIAFPFTGNENGGRGAARQAANRSLSDLWTTIYRACGGQGNFGEDVAGPISELWAPA